MINLYGISCILTGITSLSLAIFVYVKGYRHRLARIWSVFAITATIYGFGAFMVTCAKDASEAFFWWQASYLGVILIPFLFVCLVYEFLGIRRPFIIKFIGLWTVLFLISNFFFKKLFINQCTLHFEGAKWIKPIYFVYPPGPLLYVFIFFAFIGWVIYAHLELVKHYRQSSGLKRNQAKYFLFGSALGFLGGATSFLPCFGIKFYPILNFTVPLYFFLVSYAILRYRLMDIKVAITRTGIFVAVYTLVLGMPFAIAVWLKGQLIGKFGINWWAFPLGLMAGLATLGPFIYIYLNRKAEQRLLREQHRYQEILKQVAREMTRIHNLKKLLNLIVYTVTKTVRISHSAIYLLNTESGDFLLQASRNLKKKQTSLVSKETSLVAYIDDQGEVLVYEEIKQKAQENLKPVFRELEKEMELLNAAVIIPSFLDDRLLALLVLGDKRSGKIYTSEDLRIFSVLASQAALAIESALLYENMEEQVTQRTKELVDIQKQLIQAEKLATVGTLAGGVAHEINNPLTAILTNTQMLLATSGTTEAELTRESLELIEEATKRCRTIVKKLMTFARKPLESATISKVNLLDVLNNVLSFVGYQLKQDNIKIITKIKEDAYLVMGNDNEFEQVVTNLILNAKDAIKQTKKSGAIYIFFSKNDEWIKMEIKDGGAGIPKELIPRLFDPFFTTKDVGKGLGLGLSICQAIVEKNNGLISVESEPNNGTTFTVQLPRAKEESTVKSRV